MGLNLIIVDPDQLNSKIQDVIDKIEPNNTEAIDEANALKSTITSMPTCAKDTINPELMGKYAVRIVDDSFGTT